MWRLGILLLATACGRYGFDDLPHSNPDAGTAPGSPDAPDAPGPQLLACGSPSRFTIGTDQQGFASIARDDGFAAFTSDTPGALWGWSFELDGGTLVESADDVQLGSGVSAQLGGAAVGDQMVLASGLTAGGTQLSSLDASLDVLGTPNMLMNDTAATVPVASSVGLLAFASTQGGVPAIDVVGTDGMLVSGDVTIGSTGDMPSYVAAVATTSGFALGYADGTTGTAKLATFDEHLDSLVADTTIDAGSDMRLPWFAYSPSQNEFLVVWHQKDVTNDDDVWGMIVDQTLTTVVAPFEIAPYSTNAVAGADATGFWVAYDTYDPAAMAPNKMAASRVTPSGEVTARPVTSSGGTPQSWALVERDGQVVLTWTESGGSGPNLYFDPMCS
ncbi:MAG TPA: hypothetical protein VGG74_12575 [Kofleriaceae bacterium]|jgi:hypothetical protein